MRLDCTAGSFDRGYCGSDSTVVFGSDAIEYSARPARGPQEQPACQDVDGDDQFSYFPRRLDE
ncbi:hypothetical protein Tdes44962_MAKER06321 [Teratosphaeria destructans]|uniref:Uncharacterized protein n=1 Tax=Teratosphaeria destructans TaxID=418781 RepID=A0A9W7SHN2_9PEZI|nr:hypothetical protein Tdes44962_MAKER06321 [Teratosphaeria destructans]